MDIGLAIASDLGCAEKIAGTLNTLNITMENKKSINRKLIAKFTLPPIKIEIRADTLNYILLITFFIHPTQMEKMVIRLGSMEH